MRARPRRPRDPSRARVGPRRPDGSESISLHNDDDDDDDVDDVRWGGMVA